jgi:hypothetical protein
LRRYRRAFHGSALTPKREALLAPILSLLEPGFDMTQLRLKGFEDLPHMLIGIFVSLLIRKVAYEPKLTKRLGHSPFSDPFKSHRFSFFCRFSRHLFTKYIPHICEIYTGKIGKSTSLEGLWP